MTNDLDCIRFFFFFFISLSHIFLWCQEGI